jgi:hypothetical protein
LGRVQPLNAQGNGVDIVVQLFFLLASPEVLFDSVPDVVGDKGANASCLPFKNADCSLLMMVLGLSL